MYEGLMGAATIDRMASNQWPAAPDDLPFIRAGSVDLGLTDSDIRFRNRQFLDVAGDVKIEGVRSSIEQEPSDSEVGDDNTVIGTAPSKMGSGNTIINAADAQSNVILNRGGTAIGRGARADSTSIAIGAGAGAGGLPQLVDLLAELRGVLLREGDPHTPIVLQDLMAEVQAPKRDAGKIQKTWGAIKVAATTNEAASLVLRIAPLVALVVSALH
jgi:hypothetical protein